MTHPDPQRTPVKVVVVDLNMSFPSMVKFMVKWAIAAIPALIILMFICAFLFSVLYGAVTLRT